MNPIEGLLNVSMEKIKAMVDVNTIVGDPVTAADGTTVIPVSKVSFGFGAGGSEFAQGGKDTDNNGDNTMFGGGAGSGVSINPIAFLVVGKDQVRILPITNNVSTADRIIDSVPDILNKINGFIKDFTSKNDSSKEENVQDKEEEQE
ncbi:MAG: GerW family sporulation protein [Oscillospiraceae bacterium]|nr:GerW family sporulation protein [Oscillospiraceae bacterium]